LKPPKNIPDPVIVAAVSGGPDSIFLLHELVRKKEGRIVVGHVNHGVRGTASDKDQELVEKVSERLRLEKRIHIEYGRRNGVASRTGKGAPTGGTFPPGFEEKARRVRRAFLKRLAGDVGAGKIAMAHTADDQVETILMRFLEGAGIAGLKGIPRETEDGIVRPILDVWKEAIVKDLKRRKLPFRSDASNADTRFERNWVRRVLIPLLEKRYGAGVKKRIFTLGERFREIDDYLEAEADRWIGKKMKPCRQRGYVAHPRRKFDKNNNVPVLGFARDAFSRLPTFLRVRILQKICFDRLGSSPNERLLAAMDRIIVEGGPSARLNVGSGRVLANRYEEARFEPAPLPGMEPGSGSFLVTSERKITPAQAKRLAMRGDAEAFDAARIRAPLSIRPLRIGDRILPFGLKAEKKVKEILIDRKVPRGERWGRPVVCDAERRILWIPGVLRSAHAPVTPATRKAAILRVRSAK
jgi:tRNA(Ile)-lysidine synthase